MLTMKQCGYTDKLHTAYRFNIPALDNAGCTQPLEGFTNGSHIKAWTIVISYRKQSDVILIQTVISSNCINHKKRYPDAPKNLLYCYHFSLLLQMLFTGIISE